jgi:hypothetical protein
MAENKSETKPRSSSTARKPDGDAADQTSSAAKADEQATAVDTSSEAYLETHGHDPKEQNRGDF